MRQEVTLAVILALAATLAVFALTNGRRCFE